MTHCRRRPLPQAAVAAAAAAEKEAAANVVNVEEMLAAKLGLASASAPTTSKPAPRAPPAFGLSANKPAARVVASPPAPRRPLAVPARSAPRRACFVDCSLWTVRCLRLTPTIATATPTSTATSTTSISKTPSSAANNVGGVPARVASPLIVEPPAANDLYAGLTMKVRVRSRATIGCDVRAPGIARPHQAARPDERGRACRNATTASRKSASNRRAPKRRRAIK